MRVFSFLLLLVLLVYSCSNRENEKIEHLSKKIEQLEKEIVLLKKEKIKITDIQNQISQVVDQIYPIVVTIFTYQRDNKEKYQNFFRYFDEPNPFESESLGSGFVIKKDENFLYIATNAHVIGKSKKIIIKFFNGYETKAKIQGIDTKTDIAVLKVKINDKIENINPAKCGTIKNMKTGYFVIAAGSPYSLGHTFTFGIISALGRSLGISTFENFIQTDAAINPGDSGGPLVNINGEVIGMNTAIIQTGQGLGFAIPIDTVKNITDELIKYGKVIRGWLGVLVQDISQKLKEKYNIKNGVIVVKVFDFSPAKKFGIKTGDIILSLNGKPVRSASELKDMISNLKPGQRINLKVLRQGREKSIDIVIEELPSS